MNDFLKWFDPTVLAVLGAFIGMIVHMLKKRLENGLKDGETELSVFYKYIVARPVTTVIALVSAGGVAMGLQVESATPIQNMLIALTAGFASNSLANRPGESQ